MVKVQIFWNKHSLGVPLDSFSVDQREIIIAQLLPIYTGTLVKILS